MSPQHPITLESLGGISSAAAELMVIKRIQEQYDKTVSTRFDKQDKAISQLQESQTKVERSVFRLVGDEQFQGDFQRMESLLRDFIDRQDAANKQAEAERQEFNARLEAQENITAALEKRAKASARTLNLIAAVQLSGHVLWKIAAPLIAIVYFIHKLITWVR